MDLAKLITEKGSTLSRWQTYTILFILTLAVIILPTYTITTNFLAKKLEVRNINEREIISREMVNLLRDMNHNIVELNTTVKNNNLNNVTKDAAASIYEDVFQRSKFKIVELVMYTIVNNHIDDAERRVVITKTMKVSILNMYADDYEKLSTFKYKETRLNKPLDSINPSALVDDLLVILFDSSTTHDQRRQDAMRYLDNEFNRFYQHSINSI